MREFEFGPSGRFSSPGGYSSGIGNWFHEWKKTSTPSTAMPGATSESMTWPSKPKD